MTTSLNIVELALAVGNVVGAIGRERLRRIDLVFRIRAFLEIGLNGGTIMNDANDEALPVGASR